MTSSQIDRSLSSHSTVSRTSSLANHRRRASESESDLQDAASTSDMQLREYMEKVYCNKNQINLVKFCSFYKAYAK